MEKHKNIPKLRFPEYKGEWERKKLREVAERVITKNISNNVKNVFTNSAVQGIVNQRDFFDKDIANQNNLLNYYVVEKNDFIYNPRISNFAPVGPISRNRIGQGVMSPLYSVFKFKVGELDFLETYFSTTLWYEYLESIANYGARFDRMNITIKDFYEMPLPFPTLPEQKRIASFFTVLDKKIAELKQKKKLLEQYKKGVMQKLFSQELRFKNENGKEFQKWAKKPLGKIGETYNGLTGKTKENFGEGKPYIQYKQIFDNTKIDVSKFDFVQVDENENQNRAKYGDVFFTTSSETPLEIGYSSVLLENVEELYLNSFCFGYRINSFKELSPTFAQYLFRSPIFRKEVIKLGQGSTRYNMSKVELMKIEILLPSEKEQSKISAFLETIDEKIIRTTTQLQQTQQYKKGLLQNMFI
jgi:type I restriction enzyme S subunit